MNNDKLIAMRDAIGDALQHKRVYYHNILHNIIYHYIIILFRSCCHSYSWQLFTWWLTEPSR